MKRLNEMGAAAAAAAFVLGAGAAQANLATSGNINFDGQVSASCSFSSETDGALGVSTNNLSLDSTLTGGAPGSVAVTSNDSVEVTFSQPSFTANDGSITGATTSVKVGSGAFVAGSNTVDVSAGTTTLAVNVKADKSTVFAAGNYTLTTVATCAAPQIAGGGVGEEDDD